MAEDGDRHRAARALVLAAIVTVPVGIALVAGRDSGEGTPLPPLFLVISGYVAVLFWPPIALSMRRGARWSDVGVVAAGVFAGHAALALISDSTGLVLASYLAASAAATGWILHTRKRRMITPERDL